MGFQDKLKPVGTSTPAFKAKMKPVSPPSPEPEKKGVFKSIVQGIARAPLRLTTNLINAGEQAGNLFKPGRQDASQKERDFGYFGKVAPAGQKGNFAEKVRDSVGVGTELASTVIPAGKVPGVIAKGAGGQVLRAIGMGAGSGALSGTLAGVGSELQEEDPNLVRGAIKTALGAAGGTVVGALTGGAVPLVQGAFRAARGTVAPNAASTVRAGRQQLVEYFTKATRPTIVGKKDAAASRRYEENALRAVDTIIRNKQNLKFVSDEGEEVIGATPQNLRQFADAIDQTKKSIYGQYDALATQAGEAGAVVDLNPIASELDKVIENKALQLSHPNAVSYAQTIKDRFAKSGQIDTKTAQEVIQNYNSSLEAFYRNPTFESASRAAIDAGVVRNLREQLDEVITKSTGPGYQELRNQYAALKAIEADVIKRANVDARRNNKGLIDFADIFSGGDMVQGLLTMNPSLFARGAAQKGITAYFKALNDPNRSVRLLFEAAERNPGYLPQMPSSSLNSSKQKLPTNTPSATPPATNTNSMPETVPQAPKSSNAAPVKPPGEAYAAVGGFEKDEEGNLTFNPEKAALSMAGVAGITRSQAIQKIAKKLDEASVEELARFVQAAKQGLFKANKQGEMEFPNKEVSEAFNNGMMYVNFNSETQARLSQATIAKIASFYDDLIQAVPKRKTVVPIRAANGRYNGSESK